MPFQKTHLYYRSSNMPLVKSGNLEPYVQRANRKWMKKVQPLNCDSNNSMEAITLNRIGSLIVLLIIGVLFAILAVLIELCHNKMTTTKNDTQIKTIEEVEIQAKVDIS